MRTNPEARDDMRIGKKIDKPEPPKPAAPKGLSTNIPVPVATNSDKEMIAADRKTLGGVSTGWLINPDRVTIPKMSVAESDAVKALEQAKQAGTLTGALEQALTDFNRAMDDAGWRQPVSLLEQSYQQPTLNLIPPRSWASLSEENAKLRARVADLSYLRDCHLHRRDSDVVVTRLDEYAIIPLEEYAELRAERDEFKADYERACKTIAEMHEAATGVRGEAPRLGVVEDVAEIRAQLESEQSERIRLTNLLENAGLRP